MCLIAWRWQPTDATPLVLLANRDEFYARPTQALAQWPDSPVIAGRSFSATLLKPSESITNFASMAMILDLIQRKLSCPILVNA